MSLRYPFERNEEVYKNIPCQNACPVHTDVKEYVNLIGEGRLEEAYNLILETNPFPSICGRVCQHFCEADCSRQNLDRSVSICTLKRAASDYVLKRRQRSVSKAECTLEKIAVIGAGPAGLTTAHDLARIGYRVTVFESLPYGGGMLRVGIPAYRLPREIIDAEIANIQDLGVDINYNTTIGKDIKIEDLMRDYAAVLVTAGAHKPVKLGIPGEDFDGLIHGSTFMKNVNLGIDMGLKGKKLGVVGGGFTAMDVSRSAIRLGASDSYIIYRRTRDEIPVNEKEIVEAEDEGVQFKYLISPLKLVSKDNKKLSGIECIKNELGEPDASGRRRPVPIKGSEFVLDIDFIVPAVSQSPDMFCMGNNIKFQLNKWGNIDVDPETFETNIKGVYACGDFLTGTRDVINVIADGHKTAIAIDKYVRGGKITNDQKKNIEIKQDGYPLKESGYDSIKRHQACVIPIEERLSTFKEVETGFDIEDAIEEGKRCLSCDHAWNQDSDECFLCYNCVEVCPTGALEHNPLDELTHNRHFNEGIPFSQMDVKPIIIKMNLCIRCGLCSQVCPAHCINFQICKEKT